jgi:hypothetical protein
VCSLEVWEHPRVHALEWPSQEVLVKPQKNGGFHERDLIKKKLAVIKMVI